MITSLTKVKEEIKNNKLDAVLISSVSNIIYLTNYSGFSKEEREAYLVILKNKQYILTDGRYTEAIKLLVPDFKLIEISSKLSFEKAIEDLAKKHNIKRVGFDHHDITVAEHKKLSSCFNDLNLPREISKKFFRGHFSLNNLRAIKNEEEISKIEKACELGDKAFKYILDKIKSGITEKQLAFEIEFFIKKHGGDISFPPIVAFGANSAIPHHKTSDQQLMTKDLILLDFGAKIDNYCSDMTRTVFFGSANAEFKRIYNTVLEAQQKAIEYLTSHLGGGPLRSEASRMDSSRRRHSLWRRTAEVKFRGIKAFRVDKVARNYILEKRFPTIPHSLGHGIGINVHEAPHLSPKSKDILKPGTVFTIEPGIYIANFGGVRIEDVVVLEKQKLRLLTKSSKEIIEI